MANVDPILTSESSADRGFWNKGSLQVDGDLNLPTSLNSFTNPDLRTSGKLRYNTDTNYPEYFNGNSWQPLLAFVSPNEFTGTDTQKIQSACDKAAEIGLRVVIDINIAEDNSLWMIDEAVLLHSNTTIYIVNTKLKLSDTSRDNVFRSANCGDGITDPEANPINNVFIYGIGDAVIEGADNPRATGDSGKTLSLTSNSLTGSLSYGTDAGVPSEKQTGDWRNVGLLFGYTNNLEIKGLSLVNMHCYAISMEHCTRMNIDNIYVNCPAQRVYAGNNRTTKNNDGINVRFGGSDFSITNVYGVTGDDAVAMTTTTLATQPAGSLFTTNVTGNMVHEPIENGYINNIQTDTYFNNVRVFNTLGSIIRNITITNIIDTATSDTNGAAILFGDNNAIYGGPTAIGECSNITVNNVVAKKKRWCIRVLGSISESHISNLYYDELPSLPNVPIFFDEDSDGARQLTVDNVIYNGVETEMSTTRDGATGERTGLINDAINGLTFTHRVKGVDAVDDEDLVTLQQLALKANDSGVVHTTGNETIGGTKTLSTAPILNDLNASQILATNGAKQVQTLTTSTYPNLTELSRLKGITSSVQPQIDSKAPTNDAVLTGTTTAVKYKLSALNTAPSSASDTGTTGEIRIDADYIFICVATNTWKRVAISTW